MDGIRIGAFNATGILNNINRFSEQFSRSVVKISSGSNQLASEEPYMISISERLKSAITENTQMIRNIRDRMGMLELERSKSLLKVDVMHRIRELAVQYKNDTLSDSEKRQIQDQVNELSKIINEDHERFAGYDSDIMVGVKDKLDLGAVSILSVQSIEDTQYAVYRVAAEEGEELSFSDIVSRNNTFIVSITGMDAESPEYVYQAEGESDEEEDTVPRYSYDLSADGTLDAIDKELNRHSGSAVGLAAKYNTLEYRLDFLMNENVILKERLNNMTATDMAEETVNLMKSKLMMELGSEMLKLHQKIEKNMVMALISSL